VRPSPTGGAVLAATDVSDPSLPAVTLAAAEARRRGARFRLVHCLGVAGSTYLGGPALPGVVDAWPLPQAMVEQLEASARERLASALAALGADGEVQVLRDEPVPGVLGSAAEVVTSLIVVGTRGRTGLARLALGSVAEAVINRATCSVMVVPLHGE
jgi:nucleotide-binding universal stress UspA family protein